MINKTLTAVLVLILAVGFCFFFALADYGMEYSNWSTAVRIWSMMPLSIWLTLIILFVILRKEKRL
jgi:Zn-dependent protease with chaperone function